MDRIEWSTAVEWREEMTKFLFSRKIGVFDPCNKPTQGYDEGEDVRQKRKELKDVNLYGGVRKDIAKMSEFFRGVEDLVKVFYDEYMTRNQILTHIYKRPMKRENLGDLNAQKLFNYYIQAYETERNVTILNKLHTYLLEKKTNIVHYNYDSFLFDYSKEDGKETIYDIQKILQEDDFIIHSKVGNTYGTLKDYEF